MSNRTYRPHTWIDGDIPKCLVCFISAYYHDSMVEFDSLIEWDCESVVRMNAKGWNSDDNA